MEDIDKFINEELPKSLLTKEQFKKTKEMKFKGDSLKYIKETAGLSLKESAWYYDFYINNEL